MKGAVTKQPLFYILKESQLEYGKTTFFYRLFCAIMMNGK